MNRHFILFAFAFAAALSGFAKTFDVDISTGRPAASNEAYYHGETIEFRAVRGKSVVTNVEYSCVYYQTNGMDSVWWHTDGLVFHPTNDVGAASYRFFLEGRDDLGRDWHANGLLRLLPSPGFTPNTIEPPVARLDFAAVDVLNPPWTDPDYSTNNTALVKTIEATAPAPGDYAAVSNAAVHAAATNALQDAAISTLNDTKASKADVDPLLFAQHYPEGNVKSAAEFTPGIKYDDPDTVNRTITVKTFCFTGDSANDNSDLSGRVVIPPFVDEQGNPYISDDGTRYKVVGVSGMSGPYGYNNNQIAVVAPNTVTGIGERAFNACVSLTSVSLPAATSINDYAFAECYALASVDFGDTPRSSVPSLGYHAFYSVPANCKIIVPYAQYDEWKAADGWRDLQQEFVRHAEKADKPATFTTGNLAKFDANGNPTDSTIPAANVAQTSDIDGKQDKLPYPTNAIPYAAISGKPTLATVATSGSYNDLSNKPTIPTVPTNVSAFNNDAGYLTGYKESDPTVSSWAKQPTKPTYTAEEVGATTAADVYRLVAGTNVVLVVTNYNSATHAAAMKLQHLDPESGQYVTYWDEMRQHGITYTNGMNYTDAAIAERAAPRAWSGTTSGLGSEAPAGVTWISTPETVIAGGFEYEKVVTSAGAVWVLTSNGMSTGATSNSFFRVAASDGTELFSIEKTDSYLIGVNADGITRSGNTVTIPINVVGAEHPYIRCTKNLVNPTWVKEDEGGLDCAWATVSWSGTTGAYVATVTTAEPQAFFYFEYMVEGQVKIKNSAKTEMSGGILFNGTTYLPTVNGNKLEFVAQ